MSTFAVPDANAAATAGLGLSAYRGADGGWVPDAERIDFLHQHLMAARRALDDGVDLRGYFAWSLLDAFAWAFGYAKRFGIRVDYDTRIRTLKDSAQWYAGVIAAGAITRP